jgi:hypothetical protein
MDTITVSKADLIETLKKNRAEHKALYDKAVTAYTRRFVDEAKRFAEESVRRAANGMAFAHFQWLPVPEEHTEDFDRALDMLAWDINDTVELSTYEFQQYVQNNWKWGQSFTSNTTSYIAGGN